MPDMARANARDRLKGARHKLYREAILDAVSGLKGTLQLETADLPGIEQEADRVRDLLRPIV